MRKILAQKGFSHFEQNDLIKEFSNLNTIIKKKGNIYFKKGYFLGECQNGNLFSLTSKNKFKTNLKNNELVLAKIVGQKQVKILKKINFSSNYLAIYKNGKIINLKNGFSRKINKKLKDGNILKINNKNIIIKNLGNINESKIDEKIALNLYDKDYKFSEKCLAEANSFGQVLVSNHKDRMDLTELDFCTIDPKDAKDFDDAIYFDEKNMDIYVAIADVSYYVLTNGEIDKEAKKRGYSIYFPHKCLPMLPHNLSENLCSLKPNETRLAYCFKISLDKELNVKKEELFEAIIISKNRYNYEEVDKFLKEKSKKIPKWLIKFNKIAKNIRKKRLSYSCDFGSNELKIELKNNEIYKTFYENSETDAHNLVQEAMLLANKAAAKKIKFGIFRNHAKPDYIKIYKLIKNLQELGIDIKYEKNFINLVKQIKKQNPPNLQEINLLLIKSQKNAIYEKENKGHFALGFDRYAHFTSPIRRYCDLFLHRILKSDGKFLNFLLNSSNEICEDLSQKEKEIQNIEREFKDRKFARWAVKNIDKIFNAYVIGKDLLRLDDEIKGARIFANTNELNIFTKVKFKITKVNLEYGEIYGKIEDVNV